MSSASHDLTVVTVSLTLLVCGSEPATTNPGATEPLFVNSIVATEIDFITAHDADSFISLEYIGIDSKEMPDKRYDELFDKNTFVFESTYADSAIVEIWAHSSFGSVNAAEAYASKLTGPLGKLPGFMRNTLSHVVLHPGNETAFAESKGHFFVMYADNIDTRVAEHDLEETIFHESVHATLDAVYLESPQWQKAQTLDSAFITEYARNNPFKEDFAETALFVYTMLKHPNHLSNDLKDWIRLKLPNRLKFFQAVFQ